MIRNVIYLFLSAVMLLVIYGPSKPEARERVSADRGERVVITREEVARKVIEFVGERPELAGDRIRLGEFRFRRLSLPGKNYEVEIEERRKGKRGNLSLGLTFKSDRRRRGKKVFVNVPLEVLRSIAKVKVSRGRGESLPAGDYSFVEKWLPYGEEDYVTDIEEVAGSRLNKKVRAGEFLKRDWLSRGAAVKRGDRVTIVAENGAVRLTSPGIVRQEAAIGEKIPVLNLTSKKIVVAMVVDKNRVRIEF